MTAPKPLPNFDLASKTEIDPGALIPRDGSVSDVDQLMLTFAVVFNDLKGILLFQGFLEERPPQKDEGLTEYSGQYHGLHIQLRKIMCGIIFEFLKLIDARQDVIETREFQRLLKKFRRPTRRAWKEILSIATEKTPGKKRRRLSPFAHGVLQIRNNFSFHYTQPKPLVAGYRKFFYQRGVIEGSEFAVASLGLSAEQSRFYYADVASQYAMRMQAGADEAAFEKELGTVLRQTLRVLGNLLDEHCNRAFKRSAVKM